MKLNELKCKNLKPKEKTYRLSDGAGLYIEVKPNGGKYWRLGYRFAGKQKVLSFGVYPEVTLKEARDKRDEARKHLRNLEDPAELKRQKKLEIKHKYSNNFEAIAREWHSNKKNTWKESHARNILSRLEKYIFPKIGKRPIKELTHVEILEAIRPIEKEGKHEMAHRALQMTSNIYRYAVASGRVNRDITIDMKGALVPVRSKHYAHLSEKELPEFLNSLEAYDTEYNGSLLTKLAFKLLILTFTRSGEVRGAKWDEFEFDKNLWRIPAERMKMKDPHLVPLSKQSIEIVKQLREHHGDWNTPFLFPSQQTANKVMSENTFLRVIEKMGYKGITTAHGFRSTASTILNENGFKTDVIERQLSHVERDQVRAAYNHADYLQERRDMMQWWADHLDKLRDSSNG